MGKLGPLERAELANQIRGIRIPGYWDAIKYKWYKIKQTGAIIVFQPAKFNLLEHSTSRNEPIDMLHKNECFEIYKAF